MKWIRIVPAVIAMGILAACASLNQDERGTLQSYHVPHGLYDRMIEVEPLSVGDIIVLSQKGVPPDFIIHYLWKTRAEYHLIASEIDRLKKAGVNQRVIDYLRYSGSDYSYRRAYSPAYYDAYPYDPYYYPYPYGYGYGPRIFIGGGYYRHGYWH